MPPKRRRNINAKQAKKAKSEEAPATNVNNNIAAAESVETAKKSVFVPPAVISYS